MRAAMVLEHHGGPNPQHEESLMSQAEAANTTSASEIALTPKGERYAAEHSADPLLYGIQTLPMRKLRRLRKEAEEEIDRLLALIDRIDGDADLEPSLGAPEIRQRPGGFVFATDGAQLRWARGARDDREDDGDDLEPSLCGHNQRGEVDLELDPVDQGEEDLGWTRAIKQQGQAWSGENTGREMDEADKEPSLGSENQYFPRSQEHWADGRGRKDDREDDAGDNAEDDPAEAGVGDEDALDLIHHGGIRI